MGYAGAPIVSIQRIEAGTARDRHESWAVMLDCDTILAPPIRDIHDPSINFEVLIASAYKDRSLKIERIAVRRIEVYGLANHAKLAVPFFHLAQSSHHVGMLPEPEDLDAFLERAVATGDVWGALEMSGVIPKYVRHRRLSVLDVVVEEEGRRRKELVVDRLRKDGDIEFWPCCLPHWGCCKSGVPWPTDVLQPRPEDVDDPPPYA